MPTPLIYLAPIMKPSTSPPKLLTYPAILIAIVIFYLISAPTAHVFMQHLRWRANPYEFPIFRPKPNTPITHRIVHYYYQPLSWLCQKSDFAHSVRRRYEMWLIHVLARPYA